MYFYKYAENCVFLCYVCHKTKFLKRTVYIIIISSHYLCFFGFFAWVFTFPRLIHIETSVLKGMEWL